MDRNKDHGVVTVGLRQQQQCHVHVMWNLESPATDTHKQQCAEPRDNGMQDPKASTWQELNSHSAGWTDVGHYLCTKAPVVGNPFPTPRETLNCGILAAPNLSACRIGLDDSVIV